MTCDIVAYCGGGMVESLHLLQDGVAGSSDCICSASWRDDESGLELNDMLELEA